MNTAHLTRAEKKFEHVSIAVAIKFCVIRFPTAPVLFNFEQLTVFPKLSINSKASEVIPRFTL
jgi:hypothetical protein